MKIVLLRALAASNFCTTLSKFVKKDRIIKPEN